MALLGKEEFIKKQKDRQTIAKAKKQEEDFLVKHFKDVKKFNREARGWFPR
jgi:hypothetical protein